MSLPAQGRPWREVRADLIARGGNDAKWRDGRTAMYVFNAGPELLAIQQEAYTLYMPENGLGPAAFPSLAQMEREVVANGLALLNAPASACGSMTSGGSESIFLAIKAARDHARASGKAKTGANIVVAKSAHLAFDKAAHIMDLEIRRVPVSREGGFAADPALMAEAVDDATLLIAGSAPCFPFGIIDPIAALGEIAEARGIWLHVDACVGGYFAPFARMNGTLLPDFDFAVPGVTSISADLHKFGYAAKGASTVFFRTEDHMRHMPFESSAWNGAPMKTPTLAGTRPGGAISAAWAVQQVLGIDGYRALQAEVSATREHIEAGVKRLGFEILGQPKLSITSFRHPDIETMALYAGLRQRGWFTSVNTDPASLHLMLSPKHADVAGQYLSDLAASMSATAAPVPEARYS